MKRPRNSSGRHGHRKGGQGQRPDPIVFTDEGVPAATADAPSVSPVVVVSDESQARFPWLPRRVIAGSVWRGPQNERVTVDASGNATPAHRRPITTAA